MGSWYGLLPLREKLERADTPALVLKAPGIRLERCAGSGDLAHGHGHLCPCGQMFPAPPGAEGGPWSIPEHDGECSW